MSKLNLNPWELGEDLKSIDIPLFVKGDFTVVKLAEPKTKTIRDGIVATFLMTSYEDEYGKKIDLVEANESPEGYDIKFLFGKRGLIGTKFRGPQNQYKFINPDTKSWYQINAEKLTLEFAVDLLSKQTSNWAELSEIERDALIDEYFERIFLFGLSQDLMLPSETSGDFVEPIVGLKTKLYRVTTPPAPGERFSNKKITKWERGKPSLDGEYTLVPPELAVAMYDEYKRRDEDQFDPTTFKEKDDVI